MRLISAVSDVVMGLILGLFLYAAASRIWTALEHPLAATFIFAAAILIVLFRRPHGSLARKREEHS